MSKDIDQLKARQNEIWAQMKSCPAADHSRLMAEWNGLGLQIKGLIEQAKAAP
ncbi:MAG: hypothetical protein AAF360_02745 [Pseudomonadota bacterium]